MKITSNRLKTESVRCPIGHGDPIPRPGTSGIPCFAFYRFSLKGAISERYAGLSKQLQQALGGRIQVAILSVDDHNGRAGLERLDV